MNSTSYNWETRLRLSFERLQSSKIPSFSNDYLRYWLVIIGITVCVLMLLLLFIRLISKIRQMYRSTDLMEDYPKSRTEYSRCQRVKRTVNTRQIINKYSNYEPIHNGTSNLISYTSV
jgi:Na+-transporting methylmalonyl-CoA/oxaloacetate decarboxylase gamma subunit